MRRKLELKSKLCKTLALVALLALTACGRETFERQEQNAAFTANQFLVVQPKVDIVLFQDTSASMLTPLNFLKPQLIEFINNIDSNWDFHFVVLPLQAQDNINGKYVIAKDCSTISSPFCLPAGQANFYDSVGGFYPADGRQGSSDEGFIEMQGNLSNFSSMVSTGFLRGDAILVVIPFTNGQDTSGMVFPQDWLDLGGGNVAPDYGSANAIASFNTFTNFLSSPPPAGLKLSPSQLSFYSVVSPRRFNGTSCQGAPSFSGSRYSSVSTAINLSFPGVTNGQTYNICTNELLSVLGNISVQMQEIVFAIEFNFLVLDEKPVRDTIVIKKNGVEIPESASNGWTLFLGGNGEHSFETNKSTSFAPFVGNNQSGFFIELHGSARFSGSDQIEVVFQQE